MYSANKNVSISHTHHFDAAVLSSFDGGSNRLLINQHRQATINEYFHLMVMVNDVRCRRAEGGGCHGGGPEVPLLLLLLLLFWFCCC